ncbi:MAG: phosphate regulon transcriptional regulator PhoB [Rhodospirillales bacterium]|nr:phosphate regulon transcriptional regulator PhoB [Rhodospirillales bacterium]
MGGVLKPVVLVVEDEPNQAEMLIYNLEAAGYQALHAPTGEDALALAKDHEPDMILLDWMLPGISGMDVCRALRKNKQTAHVPIIMLTARGEEADRVQGLDNGADDYVVKPYLPSELLARVRAMLRRMRPTSGDKIEYGELVLDLDERKAKYFGDPVHLSATEYRILAAMAEKPGKVFSRERLLNLAWDRDADVELRTVDVHIRRLRKALSANGKEDPVRTVRGAGYSLAEAGE